MAKKSKVTERDRRDAAPRATDKQRHVRGDRRDAPALRGSDWPTNDLLEAKPSTASRKRSRTADARAERNSH